MTVTTAPPSLDDPELGETFLRLVGDGDENAAVDVVGGLLDAGVRPQRIMADLIAPTQCRIGELWAANKWSVAREHAATAISERALAAVAARTSVRPVRGRITVACVDGEWHALPVRILAETLRLDGWRVDFLGANVPGPHLVTHLHQTGPDAVALSCMLPTRLPRAHVAITACRSTGIPVIAGGRGFGPGGRYAEKLGADAWAATAEDLGHILDFLAATLYVGEETIFTDFVEWTAAVLGARGVPTAALRTGLGRYRDLLTDYPAARRTLDAGAGHLPA